MIAHVFLSPPSPESPSCSTHVTQSSGIPFSSPASSSLLALIYSVLPTYFHVQPHLFMALIPLLKLSLMLTLSSCSWKNYSVLLHSHSVNFPSHFLPQPYSRIPFQTSFFLSFSHSHMLTYLFTQALTSACLFSSAVIPHQSLTPSITYVSVCVCVGVCT